MAVSHVGLSQLLISVLLARCHERCVEQVPLAERDLDVISLLAKAFYRMRLAGCLRSRSASGTYFADALVLAVGRRP